MSTDDLDDDDDERGLDEGQDPAERCADYGCEDDGLGRCMYCDRRLLPDHGHIVMRQRTTAKDRLKRTRARAKERRAIMRGQREILRQAPTLRRRGFVVPRAADLVRMVEVRTLGGQSFAKVERLSFNLFLPLGRNDNEYGCLHCDGTGCCVDRNDCGHGLDF